MAIFSSGFLKLRRARHLIGELDQLLTEYGEIAQVSSEIVSVDKADDGGPDWVRSKVILAPLPETAPVLIGDIIHNMRTALDHMASELARLSDESDKGVYFPFAENASGLEEQIRSKKFNRCGTEAVKLLRTFKPHKQGNIELRAIHDLDVLDKYRSLMPEPRARVGKMRPFELEGPPSAEGKTVRWIPAQVIGLKFVFPEPSALAGRPLIQTLEALVDLCEGILKAFAALKEADETRVGDRGDLALNAQPQQELHIQVRIEPTSQLRR